MKATAIEVTELRAQIIAARAKVAFSNAELGEISRVHPSQVGRICRGQFKTISHNVVQICKTLGLKMDDVAFSPTKEGAAWIRLQASLRNLWDETPEGADKIVQVLNTIGALREP